MSAPLFSFQGHFQLWAYDVSHGRLLIRKNLRKQGGDKRVDIVFSDVRMLQILTNFESVTIREGTATEFVGNGSIPDCASEPGLRWFGIHTNKWDGYVCAGAVFAHEDEGGISNPSAIYEPGPLMISLAVKSSWYHEKYLPAVPKPAC